MLSVVILTQGKLHAAMFNLKLYVIQLRIKFPNVSLEQTWK